MNETITQPEVELPRVGLPKWPLLVVSGERVDFEQTLEILIRTDSWSFCTNDRAFKKALIEVLGVEPDPEDKYPYYDWDSMQQKMMEYEVLDLHNSRVVSSYIGGPHGWCDWNGRIYTSNYNIGKWPIVEDVYADWQKIAAAFPFLKLRSQLYNGEGCEEGIEPVVEFAVENGKVTASLPTAVLPPTPPPTEDEATATISHRFLNPYAERGCSIETYKTALLVTKRRLHERAGTDQQGNAVVP